MDHLQYGRSETLGTARTDCELLNALLCLDFTPEMLLRLAHRAIRSGGEAGWGLSVARSSSLTHRQAGRLTLPRLLPVMRARRG